MEISNFIEAKKRLMEFFGVEDDLFVRPCTEKSWEVVSEEDFHILRFCDPGEVKQSCVIARKNNEPMIYRKEEYTVVVALDCVKVCFVFDNKKHMGKIPKKF